MNRDEGKERVEVVSFYPNLKKLSDYILYIGLVLLVIRYGIFITLSTTEQDNIVKNIITGILDAIPSNLLKITTVISVMLILISLILNLTILRKPKFDKWIVDLAQRHLQTSRILYKGSKLFLDFDRNLNKNHIMNFITEISDKSKRHTYYYEGLDIDKGLICIVATKKKTIPTLVTVDKEKDTAWNIIPIGEAVNHKLKTISPISWTLNDNIKRDDIIETIPSTSLLIAGGTGSGKSVLQHCIVGHISRFPENYMMILCDVKQVEFSTMVGVSSVKKVALTIEEVQKALEESRKIMYDRFTFMKEHGVNNVYKLNAEVDYYTINGKDYQFDELFAVFIDGNPTIAKVEDIFKAVEEGKDVVIDENYCKV